MRSVHAHCAWLNCWVFASAVARTCSTTKGAIMGFFSKVWGGIKRVFGGIMNVFAPILKPISKFLATGLGKAIMIGLSIFTLGTAMLAGGAAFFNGVAAGNGFISSFVQGGQTFVSSLMGKAAEGAVDGAATSSAEAMTNFNNIQQMAEVSKDALQTGSATAGTAAGAGEAAASALAAGNVSAGGGTGMLSAGQKAASGVDAASKVANTNAMSSMAQGTKVADTANKAGGWLSKAAKAGGDFLKSESGGNVVGSLIEGAGNYYVEKDRQEFEDRIRRQWGDKSDPGIQSMRDTEARVGRLQAPDAQGIAQTSRTTAQTGGTTRPQFLNPIPQPGG